MDRRNHKVGWYGSWKTQISPKQSLILINNADINKIVISNEVPFNKKDFKYFIDYKHAWKIDLFAYSFQKWVH